MRRSRNPGFTLIEIMVVIVIVAILLGLLLPNLIRSKYQGQLSSCEHNERAIASAMENYNTQFRRYPEELEPVFAANFVQRVTCPSNKEPYGYRVDEDGKVYTLYCMGIHHLVLPASVEDKYPQYCPLSGLSRKP